MNSYYYLRALLSTKNLARAVALYMILQGEELQNFDYALRKAILRNFRRHGKFLFVARNMPLAERPRAFRLLAELKGEELKGLTDSLVRAVRIHHTCPERVREVLNYTERRIESGQPFDWNFVAEIHLAS